MSYYYVVLLSFSIAIPAVVGLIRFRNTDPAFYPFLILLWVGLINEVVSFYSIKYLHHNTVSTNLYYLLETFLILLQFKNWDLFNKVRRLFHGLCSLLLVLWLMENFILGSIHKFASYFIIVHSFVLALLSVWMINKLIGSGRENLLRNSIFIICTAFIIYFLVALIVEVFYLYGVTFSKSFKIYMTRILSFLNLFIYLLYTIAVIWMPRKPTYFT